ncbi:DUF1559 domain-containing protein [Gemmata obscuriglobus]|uniref:DUF1559 domain-containing protein n=1 Tax=Gemmata obscuriglobus TaxID=114 RepID=UPI0021BBDEFE|nr:DUF1559 domain-containing protein [Gemmata obscuriglobus]
MAREIWVRAIIDRGLPHVLKLDIFHFWPPHPGEVNIVFADGSVRFLQSSADAFRPGLASLSGGEAVAPE